MNDFDLDTERNEAAWVIYLTLITSGLTDTNSYTVLAESAFVAVDAFNKVKENENNGI